jgi:hypothetical protein
MANLFMARREGSPSYPTKTCRFLMYRTTYNVSPAWLQISNDNQPDAVPLLQSYQQEPKESLSDFFSLDLNLDI